MRTLLNIIGSFTLVLVACHSFGQASSPTNVGVNGDFLGWNAATADDLNFRVFNQNEFRIAVGPIGTVCRMTEGGWTFYSGGANSLQGARLSGGVPFGSQTDAIGLRASTIVSPEVSVPIAYGGQFAVRANGTNNLAIRGRATASTVSDYNIGIYGKVCTSDGKGFAIYGEADGSGTLWAGWFDGDVYHSGSWPPPSDSNLKTNINVPSESLAILKTLEPVSYSYRVGQFPSLNLPNGLHYGFLAQQVDSFLPHLVKEGRSMTKMDEDGNVQHEPVDFLGLNYVGIIPLIVGGLKERQAIIDNQTEQIESLEAAVNLLLSQQSE